jgi:hypothetical protein
MGACASETMIKFEKKIKVFMTFVVVVVDVLFAANDHLFRFDYD